VLGPGVPTASGSWRPFAPVAWDVLAAPIDIDKLLIRLEVMVEPRLELDRVSERTAARPRERLYTPAESLPSRATDDWIAAALRRAGRASDAIGRTGHTEFAVFAPASSTLARPS